jgi:hypothetical protein
LGDWTVVAQEKKIRWNWMALIPLQLRPVPVVLARVAAQ